METFKWCIRPELSIESSPKINKVQFGDGYAQRQSKGIHTLLRKYPVTVKVYNKDRFEIEDFLARHKGVEPFYFKDPYTKTVKKVVCEKWHANMNLHFTEFSCEFEEIP